MVGDRISTHKKTRDIILNKLTVTYLYETKVLSTTRDATKMLQGRFCEQGMGEGIYIATCEKKQGTGEKCAEKGQILIFL